MENCSFRALLSSLTHFLQGQSASQLEAGVRTKQGLEKPLSPVSSLHTEPLQAPKTSRSRQTWPGLSDSPAQKTHQSGCWFSFPNPLSLRVPPKEHTLVTLVTEKERKPKGVVFLMESSQWWEILNRHNQGAKWGKSHQPVLAGIPETSCLLTKGGREREDSEVACCHAPPKLQSQFSTYRFSSLLAPARVQVGGETEGKEWKQLATTSCSAQVQTRRFRMVSGRIEQHLPDNCPQCCDISCVFPRMYPPPPV